MTANTENGGGRLANPWRISGWGAAAFLLLLPLIANAPWTLSDFVFAAVMIGGLGLGLELAFRISTNTAYRAGAAAALGAAFLLIWVNLAVGIVGSEDNLINVVYFGVLPVALVGAFFADFRPKGLARVMFAAVATLAAAAVTALLAGGHRIEASSLIEIAGVTGFLAVPWLISAALFQKAARDQVSGDAELN